MKLRGKRTDDISLRPGPLRAAPGRPVPMPTFRRSIHRLTLLLAVLALPGWSDLDPPPATRSLSVVVTAAAGGNVYLNRGRADGIASGDTVVLYPTNGQHAVETSVRSVSKSSARVELPAGTPTIAINDRGEVLVPVVRLEEQDVKDLPAPVEIPEHPEWTAAPEEWDDSQPLLAPAFSRSSEEKPTRVRGRLYLLAQNNWDTENGDNEFTTARLGTEVFIENPFKDGGEIHMDAEWNLRRVIIEGADNSSTTRGRLDRFSYTWGGTREEPRFYEVGRFVQNEFPELGVLDGGEFSVRTNGGGRVGASFGYMPEPFPKMETGQDLQLAVFYRTDSGNPDDPILGVAYQNTWHKGKQDRNLVIGTLDWNPNDELSLYGSAWVDHYGSEDETKDDGLELTELRLHGVYRIGDGSGIGAHLSRTRWPELLRDEFQSTTATDILDNRTTRVGINGWHELADDVRLDGRVDRWQDEDDIGGNANLRLALRDMLYDRGEVAIAVFSTQGSFNNGKGVRLSANRSLGQSAFGVISWETARYEQDSLAGDSVDLDQQTLRASFDMVLGTTRNLSVYAEKRFGDEQDSKNLGLFFQQRF
jgi:hypothetical protein